MKFKNLFFKEKKGNSKQENETEHLHFFNDKDEDTKHGKDILKYLKETGLELNSQQKNIIMQGIHDIYLIGMSRGLKDPNEWTDRERVNAYYAHMILKRDMGLLDNKF